MDLSSRWDRFAGLFILLLAVAAMAGCHPSTTGSASAQSGTVSGRQHDARFRHRCGWYHDPSRPTCLTNGFAGHGHGIQCEFVERVRSN